MKILSIILVLLTFLLYNCSSSDVEKEKDEKELVSEVEQSLDEKSAEAPKDEAFYEEKPPVEGGIPAEEAASAPPTEGTEQPVERPMDVKISEAGEYLVEKGDSLLLISFKVYGDYRKWRQIIAENPGVSEKNLSVGSKLKYTLPNTPFEWNKNGNAHLILKGETLGTISNEHYGTIKRWKEIYENNRPMILDPNLIFAGFTLFYIPDKVAQK